MIIQLVPLQYVNNHAEYNDEANNQGLLLHGEITHDLQVATAAENVRQENSLRQRLNKAARLKAAMTAMPPSAMELQGLRVYVHASATLQSDWNRAFARTGGICVQEPRSAMVFIFNNPWDLTDIKHALTASCLGAWIMDAAVYAGKASGPAIKYKRALAMKRFIWATDRFKKKQAGTWLHILELVASQANCNWQMLADGKSWAVKTLHAQKAGRGAEVIALIMPEEKNPAVHHAFSIEEFLKFISHLEPARTSLGLGLH